MMPASFGCTCAVRSSANSHRLFSPFFDLVLVEVCFYFSSEVFFYLVNLPNDACAFKAHFWGLAVVVVPEMAQPNI